MSITTPRTITGHVWLALHLALVSLTFSLVSARIERRQAPNQMYINNPADMTASLNFTSFIVPIPISEAQSLASPYQLILDHGLAASVIPSGYFPLQLNPGYLYDIRQRPANTIPLQVQQLSTLEMYLPFVNVLGTGKAFRRSVKSYQDQLVPALVGSLEQLHDGQVANFDPAHAVSRGETRWL